MKHCYMPPKEEIAQFMPRTQLINPEFLKELVRERRLDIANRNRLAAWRERYSDQLKMPEPDGGLASVLAHQALVRRLADQSTPA